MLTVISPAKTLDFESAPITEKATLPDQLTQSRQLVTLLRKQSPKQLSKLMGISEKLGKLNAERYQVWKTPFTRSNAKQSVLAFRGDVYIGLDADGYSQRDFNFAQKNLRILSGLYGLLRPLDLIQPYRLEMGTKLPNKRGKDLYEFWGDRISKAIGEELATHRNKTLINLASNEYFRSVRPDILPGQVVTPIFKDRHKGEYKVMGFFAKKARGYMASFIVKNRIAKPDDIKAFDVDGYRFNENFSTDVDWVFTR
ncbi:MAG TPA: peroxide stress protein YaaA [Pseudomonadales bacterium]|nr:peroxide stress protein YaaA [Pseudomonadales bacterium]